MRGGLRRIKRWIYETGYDSDPIRRFVIDRFHLLYYGSKRRTRPWMETRWLGVGAQKCPLDLWQYQQIIHETTPDLVIETGTAQGGSALYLASIFDLVGRGRVVSVDIGTDDRRPTHPRITYLTASSTDPMVLDEVRQMAEKASRVMVILDSDHRAPHVLAEMRLYGPLVSPGNYMIVEDTNLNGHPVARGYGPGPMEAVEEFLVEDDSFVVDHDRERFYLTFNPNGYLCKQP